MVQSPGRFWSMTIFGHGALATHSFIASPYLAMTRYHNFWDNKLRSAKVFVLNAGMSWSSKIDRFISTGVLCTLDHLCQESGCLCVCVLCPCLSVFLVFLSCCLCVRVSGRRHWCTHVHWTTSLSVENCLWRRTLTYPWESWRVD